MPRTLIKSRLHPTKHKPKIKQERNIINSKLPPNLQSFKQKLLSGNGFKKYQGSSWFLYFIKELRRFSIIRKRTIR